ncbi:hypothetical protein [Helicobacter turcicus]|uniref:Uncharacterized protein n=1 Tax=Helicobacter turcicus TaxID=2867412 RepID=A0ABS7JNU1_9HELI|nr:hypothetical protein [Helicobacter turcicus]MBX7491029.1 hypothetical protein [Helicobacter turcicus]MBX7545844.1 hypothetical protein [Helicobacter turcicus]
MLFINELRSNQANCDSAQKDSKEVVQDLLNQTTEQIKLYLEYSYYRELASVQGDSIAQLESFMQN